MMTLNEAFEELQRGLDAAGPLLQSDGTARTGASADEFMLMSELDEPRLGFKHRFTRNYVYWYVFPRMLLIPFNPDGNFYRGYFDEPDAETVETSEELRKNRFIFAPKLLKDKDLEKSEILC